MRTDTQGALHLFVFAPACLCLLLLWGCSSDEPGGSQEGGESAVGSAEDGGVVTFDGVWSPFSDGTSPGDGGADGSGVEMKPWYADGTSGDASKPVDSHTPDAAGGSDSADTSPSADSAVVDVKAPIDSVNIPDSVIVDGAQNGDVQDGTSAASDVGTGDGDGSVAVADVTTPPADIQDAAPVDIQDASPGDSVADTSQPVPDFAEWGNDIVTDPDASEPEISEPMPLSTPYGYEVGELYAATVSENGRVAVLWRAQEKLWTEKRLVLSVSDPEVTEFEAPIVVKAPYDTSGAGGDVAADGDEYLLVWRDQSAETNQPEIRFRRAVYPELTGDDVVVYSAPAGTSLWRPYITRKTELQLVIIWQQKSSGSSLNDIFVVRSNDGGATFKAPIQVDPPSFDAYVSDALFLASGDLNVAFHGHPSGESQTNVYLRASADNGATFSDLVSISTGPDVDYFGPTMALGPSNVYLGWYQKGGGQDIGAWLSTSQDGQTWNAPNPLPGVKVDVRVRTGKADMVHASGKDNILDMATPLFVTSEDGGQSWGMAKEIPVSEGYFVLTHEIVANRKKGLLHLVWWEVSTKDLFDQQMQLVTVIP